MKNLMHYIGYRFIKSHEYDYLSKIGRSNSFEFLQLLKRIEANKEVYDCYKNSKSQILQDVFVLIFLNFKRKGFFVEFGSSDGIKASNTYLLEKKYDWKGILVEPSKSFHKNLQKNRKSTIDYRCVYNESGLKLIFNQAYNGYLSTIDKYSIIDKSKNNRMSRKRYEVKTVTLEDLLDEYNAPDDIDYLSIDTEGSEYDILQCFNFDKYRFKIITVEHNYNKDLRKKIHSLLDSKSYKRILANISRFDDWYISVKI